MYFNHISPLFTLVCALKKKNTSNKYLLIVRPLSCNPGLPHSVWLRMLLTFGSSFLFYLLLPENRCEPPRLLSFGHGRQALCQLSYIPRPCYTPSIHTHMYTAHLPQPLVYVMDAREFQNTEVAHILPWGVKAVLEPFGELRQELLVASDRTPGPVLSLRGPPGHRGLKDPFSGL